MKLDFQVHFGVNTAGHWEVPELGCVINDYRRFFLGGGQYQFLEYVIPIIYGRYMDIPIIPILGVCHSWIIYVQCYPKKTQR